MHTIREKKMSKNGEISPKSAFCVPMQEIIERLRALIFLFSWNYSKFPILLLILLCFFVFAAEKKRRGNGANQYNKDSVIQDLDNYFPLMIFVLKETKSSKNRSWRMYHISDILG